MHPALAPYQIEAAGWLTLEPNRLLCDSMGTGKSFSAIAACDLIGLRKILVVCPGMVRANWEEELNRWATVPRSVSVIVSSKQIIPADVMIVSFSILRSLPVLRYLLSRQWDVLILDEVHSAKNSFAWRTKAVYGAHCDSRNGLASKADRVWGLSGTLMPNNPSELFTHCNALFPDTTQNMGQARWNEEFCRIDPLTGRITGAKNTEKLTRLMKPHILRRLAVDVLPQLPSLRIAQVPLHPDKLPPMSSDLKETAVIVEAAVAAMQDNATEAKGRRMLAQVDQGAVASLLKWIGVVKSPAIVDYLKGDFEAGMDRVVVFARHRTPIEILTAGLPDAVAVHGGTSQKHRDEIISEFRHGSSIKSLVLQLEIGNAGIQLVSASNVVFAELPWTPHSVEQAIARLHRQGQQRNVLARMFSLQGSFDQTVGRVLERKLKTTTSFNTALTTKSPKIAL